MNMRITWMVAAGALSVVAQDPTIDLQALKSAVSSSDRKDAPGDTTPTKTNRGTEDPTLDAYRGRPEDLARLKSEEERLDQELRDLKKKEGAPRRFAADLFDFRQRGTSATEGGIAEDYVLGTGDRLNLNVFGSATFDLPVSVDGKGEIVIPKVGTVKVGGKTLGQARSAVHGLVSQNFSKTSIDLQVIKLREVRVFVLGEVYKPGGYLVPSLSSLVNVLSQAGGPTGVGSFRQIRVVRAGKVIHTLDLYPLRAEGIGNMNFSLQNGDTLFVPLAFHQVTLEGSFVRVAGIEYSREGWDQRRVLDPRWNPEAPRPEGSRFSKDPGRSLSEQERSMGVQPREAGKDKAPDREKDLLDDQPKAMQFELLPGESALGALRYAGGLMPNAFGEALTLRRRDPNGVFNVEDLPMARLGEVVLQRGDVLSALPRRDQIARVVTVTGWARVPGTYARLEGLRVGELLKREQQVLPDTYVERGEIVRTLADGATQFLPFHVAKALAGDPDHNLLLSDRDRVELFRTERMRLPKEVGISGPVTRPGKFEFHEGMRASDLLFRAGIPQKSANRLVAELARSRDGLPSEIRRLDLSKLISTETASPVDLKDEALNPRLQADDQLSVFEKPEFRVHRTVSISGQVARPGNYVLDSDKATLSHLIQRAGGLMPEAMPQAGIFLRQLGGGDSALTAAAKGSGIETPDPTTKGIEDILERLSEKKLVVDKTGGSTTHVNLFRPPVLHGLANAKLNRMVVDFKQALAGGATDVELQDGDQIIVPRSTDAALVIGETASPFASYKVQAGMKVKDLLELAGGTTRNADTWNIRLLKANGRIVDRGVKGQVIEPGDAVLVPQRIKRDSSWQEDLTALTPLAILISAIRR